MRNIEESLDPLPSREAPERIATIHAVWGFVERVVKQYCYLAKGVFGFT